MKTLYLVEAGGYISQKNFERWDMTHITYGVINYEGDWHINVGVYSTLEKAIEAANAYMRTDSIEMNYEEITLDNFKTNHHYKYDSEFDYSAVYIIQRTLDDEPTCY